MPRLTSGSRRQAHGVGGSMGQSGQVAVHVPLGVAILGLIGALLGRTRNLARASTDPATTREAR